MTRGGSYTSSSDLYNKLAAVKTLYNPPADIATYALQATVTAPRLWSAETPCLYTLVVTLETSQGTLSTSFRIGFRKVEVRDRELLVNGQPVIIHGMNRHDHSDQAGKAVTRELIESAHELARNAICPSHYMGIIELYRTTRDPRYLELGKNLVEICDLVAGGGDDNQDRLPFRQQTRAAGHAVRANYLYAGVAEGRQRTLRAGNPQTPLPRFF